MLGFGSRPLPGGPDDDRKEQGFQQLIEPPVKPGLAVAHKLCPDQDEDMENANDYVQRAIRPGLQCQGQQDHEARKSH